MNKKAVIVHRILYWGNVLSLLIGLVYFLSRWNNLPVEMGIHFGGDGNFDGTGERFYGFYPTVVGTLFCLGIAVADRLIMKKSTGLKITEKGEQLFRTELLLNLDILLFIPTVHFTDWEFAVADQRSLNLKLTGKIVGVLLLLMFAGIIVQIVTCVKYRQKQEAAEQAKTTDTMHRVCRLAAWLLFGASCLVTALVWEMEIVTDGKMQIGNGFYSRVVLLIPIVLQLLLTVIFEVITVKAKSPSVIWLADRLKLTVSLFFFWWVLLLDAGNAIGAVSSCLFLLLCTAETIIFINKSKKEKKTQ